MENFKLCQAKQVRPQEHLTSPGKAREIYWKHQNDTFASFLFLRWTRPGFYIWVWRRFLPAVGFTWHHREMAGDYWQAGHPQSKTPAAWDTKVLQRHSPAAPQSCAEPLLTDRTQLLLKPEPSDSQSVHSLLLCPSRRIPHSPKHLHLPQISSALGCSFCLGTVFIDDKGLSQAQAYLFQPTDRHTPAPQMAADFYTSLTD